MSPGSTGDSEVSTAQVEPSSSALEELIAHQPQDDVPLTPASLQRLLLGCWKVCLSAENLQSSSILWALEFLSSSLALAVFHLHVLALQNPGLLPPGGCLCARSLPGLMSCLWISAQGRHRWAPWRREKLYASRSSPQQLNRKVLREFKMQFNLNFRQHDLRYVLYKPDPVIIKRIQH